MRRALIALAATLGAAMAGDASYAGFARRADAGERLTVVFFGASLTWGANASDQAWTSYRAVVGQRLEERWPRARWRFVDAAIGGTNSQLGVFRLDRDVLARAPDLAFLDFTANDGAGSTDPETLASYEAILRRLVAGGVPVVPVLFPFRWDVEQGDPAAMARRIAHLRLAEAYGAEAGDAIALAIERTGRRAEALAELWPYDPIHPGDAGYRLFADAAFAALERAVARGGSCAAPAAWVADDRYAPARRVRLTTLVGATPPRGWRVDRPHPTAPCHDQMMTRWLDDLLVAAAGKVDVEPEPLRLRVRAREVLLLGERSGDSGRVRVTIDGAPAAGAEDGVIDASGARFGGNWNLAQVVATGLDPASEHEVVIAPRIAGGEKPAEVRLESVCVAGGDAVVDVAR